MSSLRVLVAGFITIDTIKLPVRTVTSVGGPPCYGGLICARFGLDVSALTKVGNDFPADQSVWLSRNGITLRPADTSQSQKTTRFRKDAAAGARTLTLLSRCEDLSRSQLPEARYDASIVSPIAGEVSPELVDAVAERSDFTFLDPQGILRRFGPSGEVYFGS